ncbi:hypothetical protein SAMN05428949_4860 [Chitinophaga sp. YR627]|uniref:hypothetical protein n=1 Tax=Chitinophaga sp. YR627 TaxID=1881041 RepID=UPI0008F067F4|nr:hypothetical protein [Chitinophaga sp. YR627]SFO30254.1 hypothetical protein SAMN05428949_4860 [Chitinophaga sp. YR627]
MKRYFLLFATALSLGVLSSCSDDKDNNVTPPPTSGDDVVVLKGDISANQTLTADKKYLLDGFVYVKSGVTLTIQPGTVIMGDKADKGTLVVTRGGKIMAEGTAEKPIIFTSSQAVNARSQGDWGGVIILGKGKVNAAGGEAKIEGGLVPTAGGNDKDYIYYGGTDDADNSGVLKYVRIEFAGIAYSPDNEINGLTMGGVGSGTKISYVQVYRSGDDAFEWFGGSVNCDHLVATYTWDDDFDTDNGFSGKIQFGLAHRYKAIADVSGSNGFESDNDANGSVNTPQTKAYFSNMTIVGPIVAGNSTSGINANFQHGAQIRRNSSMSLINSVIVGFPIGVYIDDSKVASHKTSQNASEGSLVFKNNIIAGAVTVSKSEWSALDAAAWTTWWTATNTTVVTKAEDILLDNPNLFSAGVGASAGTPSFLLKATSPAVNGGVIPEGLGFTNVTYRGAFDATTDWTKGWTNWSAESTKY